MAEKRCCREHIGQANTIQRAINRNDRADFVGRVTRRVSYLCWKVGESNETAQTVAYEDEVGNLRATPDVCVTLQHGVKRLCARYKALVDHILAAIIIRLPVSG